VFVKNQHDARKEEHLQQATEDLGPKKVAVQDFDPFATYDCPDRQDRHRRNTGRRRGHFDVRMLNLNLVGNPSQTEEAMSLDSWRRLKVPLEDSLCASQTKRINHV
jgi:hypothetical protein